MICKNIHHVGIWVADMGAMIGFLTDVLGFELLIRQPRGFAPGERAFVSAGDDQMFELLSAPDAEPRPDFAVHPTGHVIGTPHICFRVEDLPAWQEALEAAGYSIVARMPEEGYSDSPSEPVRALWFIGPNGVGFEFFEFENETRLQ